MINRKILTGAEYASLGASALGTVLAATTGQIAYATSPLICSLFFNVVNRNKLAQQTSHNVTHQVAEVKKSFSKDNFSLKEQIENLEYILDTKDNNKAVRQDERQSFIELKQQIDTLQRNFTRLNDTNYFDRKDSEIALIEEKIKIIDRQFDILQKTIEQSVKQQELEQQLTNFSQTITEEFNDSLVRINNFVSHEELKQEIDASTEQVTNQVYNLFKLQIENFNLIIKDNRPGYQLVFDRQGSRDVLLEALQKAQNRIILVCPWITSYGANDEVLKYCRDFLDKGGRIDIGWGHLKDIKKTEHNPICHNEFLKIVKKKKCDWAYGQIEKFIELEQRYQKCNLKLLGTHEKFLVCDRSFAMIGSHNFLTSNCHSSERELGLVTDDKNIIENLIDRFEEPPNLDNAKNLL